MDDITERIVYLRGQRKNRRYMYTTKIISQMVTREFGRNVTPGQVKHILTTHRSKLTPEERAAQCIKSQVKGVKPMPPDGTKVQCQGCGHTYWAPNVPSRCLHCPTMLRSGERLAAGCEKWREPEL